MQAYGPYEPYRSINDTIYISGQVGIDPKTKQAPASFKDQFEQIITNIKLILSKEDLSISNLVKITVFLKDIDDFDELNVLCLEHLSKPRPARSCVEVSNLPKISDTPLLIEIEAIAQKGNKL